MRGQVSVEYLVILGVVLVIMVPAGLLLFERAKQTTDQIASSQIIRIGNDLVNGIIAVYSLGRNSWTTLEVNFPDNAQEFYVNNDNELVVEFDTNKGTSQAIFFTDIRLETPFNGNITKEFHSGTFKIKIISQGDSVFLAES
ncbi:MAG TPA: hypothetical protein VJG90_00230 [Candidatus Nanoarchaeia archaeon]|nr:hypothetical protein [Candidatus Nanoarchaeia archaeon]